MSQLVVCNAKSDSVDTTRDEEMLNQYIFSISTQAAESALTEFLSQVDISLIYAVDAVKGIQLNGIEGTMTIPEAIQSMFAGTALSARQEPITGTWMIELVEMDEDPELSNDLTVSNNNPEKTQEMLTISKPRNPWLSQVMRGIGSLLIAGGTVTATAQEDVEEDIFYMSPFIVDATEDTGYTAQSTLAGTRIRTNVRELGSSISILTDEFLEDTGATDAQALLTYTANTEVGGVLGNYSAGVVGGNSRFDSNQPRRNPQNGQRIRGLTRAELTRDYFSTVIPFDQYNTSRVTLNRGPNSVLFGVGSPGGVLDHSLKQAILNETINEVKLRFDHRGSYRGTFDVNRGIIDDRLAVRVAGLYDKLKYKQEPAEEEDQRIYAAFEGVLFENANSKFLGQTSIRGHVEFGEIDSIPPDVIPPVDAFSPWFIGYEDVPRLLAVPGIDITDLGTDSLAPEDIPPGSNVVGEFIPTTYVNTITREGRDNSQGSTPYWLQIPLIYGSGNTQTAGFADPAFGNLSGIQGRIRWPGSSGRLRQDVRFSGSRIDNLPGFSAYTIQNRDIFDYHNRLLQGTSNTVETSFDVQQLAIDQTFWDGKAGVELSYNRQQRELTSRLPLSSGRDKDLHLDIALTQSNDLANPNVGRPVVRIQNYTTAYEKLDQEIVRATAFIDVDTRDFLGDKLGQWVGRHTLTALFEQRDTDFDSTQHRFVWDSDEIDVTSNGIFNNQQANGFNRQLRAITYVGPNIGNITDPNDLRVTDVVNNPFPTNGERHTLMYWDNVAKERKTAEFIAREVLLNADISRRELTSEAFALKSTFLDDHIVTILAWRKDQEKAFERLEESGTFDGDQPLLNPDGTFNNGILRLQDSPSADETDETLTTSIVGFFPEKYLFELPFGMDMSVHYYEAESFQPAGFSQNILGQRVDAPRGETSEYGFTLEFLERRLSLRVNWYETSNTNNRTSAGGALGGSWQWIGNWLERWKDAELADIPFSETGGQVAAGSYEEMYQVIRNLMPEPTRSLINPQIRDDGTTDETPINNLTSTFDFVSDGMEIELVGSIKPNWSVALNIAKQETVQSNTAPVLRDFISQVEQNIVAAGLDTILDAPSVTEEATFLWRYERNAIFPLRSAVANDGRKSQEQRTWRVNLITNYDFIEGPIKGFGVGGALRWQDEAAVGYPFLLNENDDQIPDVDNPFLGDDELNGDIWFSYERPIFDDKIDWRIQLNIRNAIRTSEDIPVFVNPDGRLAVVRIPPEQTLFITNTFRF